MRTMYQKGADRERKIVNRAREKGHIAFRSAGSHSPIDVCIIDKKARVITFVQSKMTISEKAKQRLLDEQKDLIGRVYLVNFEVQ